MIGCIDSIPPTHIGKPDVDWLGGIDEHVDHNFAEDFSTFVNKFPGLEGFFLLVEKDAREVLNVNEETKLKHHVRLRSGVNTVSVLGALKNAVLYTGSKKPINNFLVRPGGWHIDGSRMPNVKKVNYAVSSVTPTEFLIGRRFFVLLRNNYGFLSNTAKTALLATQCRQGVIFQPEPGEVVRFDENSVHRTPVRIGLPGVHHVFVTDTVCPINS